MKEVKDIRVTRCINILVELNRNKPKRWQGQEMLQKIEQVIERQGEKLQVVRTREEEVKKQRKCKRSATRGSARRNRRGSKFLEDAEGEVEEEVVQEIR